ncbi:MAG: Holliday junction resolvase RuvX [bacterium]|nr:Holliday junction resolvase RuvX [bacterium]
MQREETIKGPEITDLSGCPRSGRLLAIDPGTKRAGIAVTDRNQTIATPVKTLARTSWKKLLSDIKETVSDFDAVAVVVGLPLGFAGDEIPMTAEATDIARKLALSLTIPVFLQDERVTTYEARGRLWGRSRSSQDLRSEVDSEAASVILSDFLGRLNQNS